MVENVWPLEHKISSTTCDYKCTFCSWNRFFSQLRENWRIWKISTKKFISHRSKQEFFLVLHIFLHTETCAAFPVGQILNFIFSIKKNSLVTVKQAVEVQIKLIHDCIERIAFKNQISWVRYLLVHSSILKQQQNWQSRPCLTIYVIVSLLRFRHAVFNIDQKLYATRQWIQNCTTYTVAFFHLWFQNTKM
jgi:hypothetical protein